MIFQKTVRDYYFVLFTYADDPDSNGDDPGAVQSWLAIGYLAHGWDEMLNPFNGNFRACKYFGNSWIVVLITLSNKIFDATRFAFLFRTGRWSDASCSVSTKKISQKVPTLMKKFDAQYNEEIDTLA